MPTTDLSRNTARRVSHSLKAAGLTQRVVAKRTGIKLATLNTRLTGARPFNVAELGKIAALLGVHASTFLADPEADAA
ncbi:MAG: helix-turn-helix transcriptional regulator [Streptomycetaceae bacterium]|nr:helix-turn-helix transcriptional regulator [Streptomycetaceae bacterium]